MRRTRSWRPAPLAAEDEDAVAGEIEAVVVGCAALVESDDPEIALLELFKGADEVDDAGDAEVFGGSCAGLDRYRAQGRGAALGEDDAVDACAVSHAKERAEILRVFDAVEGEDEATGPGLDGLEDVLDGERLLRVDEGDDTLVCDGAGELGELLAGLLTDADAGLAAGEDEAREAVVLALAGDDDVIEAAAAGAKGFLDRMNTVENFHGSSLRGLAGGELGAGEPVETDSLLGGLEREVAVNVGGDADAKLAAVVAVGQGFGDGLAGRLHIRDRLGDHFADAGESVFRRGCEPGERRELGAEADVFVVLGRPADAVGVVIEFTVLRLRFMVRFP